MNMPTVSNPNQLEAYLVEPVNPDLPNTWAVQRPNPTWPLDAPIIEAVCDTAEQARRVAAGLVALQVAEQMLQRTPIPASDGQWLAFRMVSALRFARNATPAEPTNQTIVDASAVVRVIAPPAAGVIPISLSEEETAALRRLHAREVEEAEAEGLQLPGFADWLKQMLRDIANG